MICSYCKSISLQFGNIRVNVTVDLLELGHCPMDEEPEMVSRSILKWWNIQKGNARTSTSTRDLHAVPISNNI